MTTGTVGKDAGSVLLNLAAAQGGRGVADAGGFQKVWNGRMNQNSGGAVQDNAADAKGKQASAGGQVRRGDSLKAKDVRAAQANKRGAEEMSSEELEQAAEVVREAALAVMQRTADVLGISLEEVQAAMDELGLEESDVLGASGLGNLLLKLGGAEDSYALITDEELYGSYRTLMDGLNSTLQECADELGVDPEQLAGILETCGKEAVAEENLAEETDPSQAAADRLRDLKGPDEEIILTGESVTSASPVQEALQGGQEARGQADGQTRGEGKQHEDRTSHRERHDVAFGQDFRMEQIQPGAQQTQVQPQGSQWDAQTRDIMNQIMDYMRLRLNGDSSNLEMQLHPASLGTLQIQIASKGGVVTANFITQNEAVKSALESQMVELRERFEEQGVKIEAIEVTVQTHEFERNLEQGRGRGGQEPEKRSRTRRIQSGGSPTMGDMEDMEEEDALRADMLAAEGRTVDYTA